MTKINFKWLTSLGVTMALFHQLCTRQNFKELDSLYTFCRVSSIFKPTMLFWNWCLVPSWWYWIRLFRALLFIAERTLRNLIELNEAKVNQLANKQIIYNICFILRIWNTNQKFIYKQTTVFHSFGGI